MTTLRVPGTSGPMQITLSTATPLFILGRNGTGKSALIHAFKTQLASHVVYLPGTRSSVFEGEGLSLTSSGSRQLKLNLHTWDNSPDTRWRITPGANRNEKAVYDLMMAEVQYKTDYANVISQGGDTSAAVEKLQTKNSPLDKANLVLEQANLPVRMVVNGGELKAKQNGNIYAFARMSDGERTALVLIAEVIAAADGAVFLIDEPELHLHRAIAVPLVLALVRMRPTCEFIVSTHEIDLPAEVPGSKVLIVRSAIWNAEGSVSSWDIDIIDDAEAIPEDLRVDLLGSRRKILFTEGTDTSLDRRMYAVLFPKISVRSKTGCREVIKSVDGVKATIELHRADAYGLIDNDGMSTDQIIAYKARSIYALSVFAIESLYYAPELMRAIALRQAETAAADKTTQAILAQNYLEEAKTRGVAAITQGDRVHHLASRIAERQIRDSLTNLVPTREAIIAGYAGHIDVSIVSPYPVELIRLQELAAAKDLDGIIARYPVRETGALDAIAKALKFPSRADYEAAALARVSSDRLLLNTMRNKLASLSTELMS